MKTLKFKGRIGSGIGRHVELGIPGRRALPDAPPDWPDQLQPGSLNIRVYQGGYPPELRQCDSFQGVTTLDNRLFTPTFIIPQNQMRNNKLTPLPGMPDRGTAQVWRARLKVEHRSESYPVWVFRRMGSRVGEQLELVSDVHLRKTLSLEDGMEVTIELQYDNI